ncbi:MAG: DNA-directed RNA polymerase subunit alpha C-terminal domain-containing protein [Bacteroidales bacterium]|nr:DNA-directed RNA polymerase subunit alpha C-terminal domain-containing protein [Bacteroidales bacterium]
MKELILKKLSLTERGATFILSNKDLCNRIMNETPIDITKFAKKYNFSTGFITKLIKNELISWFANKPLNTNGCRKFIFEEETIEVIGKGLHYPSFFSAANKTVDLFLQLAEKIHPNPIELTLIKAAFIEKDSYKQIAETLGVKEHTAGDLVRKSTTKTKRWIHKLNTTEELNKKIAEQEVYLKSLNYLVKQAEHKTEEVVSKYENVKVIAANLSDYDLSIRSLNALKTADIETVGDLIQYDIKYLDRIRNFGKKTKQEIVEFVHDLGLKFKNEE